MSIDLKDFEIKILEMIAITNQNIKKEEEYLKSLEAQCNEGYWRAFDPENPHKIVSQVETTIKCLEEQRRTYETVISLAKSVAY